MSKLIKEGKVINVTTITIGAKGDAIAKVDSGFTIIINGLKEIGVTCNVRITKKFEKYAFAEVV